MRKKGFTLIELLAVIVVLAIIALIATPIVINIIENVKMKSAEQSAYNYFSAVKLMISTENVKGNIVLDGKYTINNGNLTLNDLTYTVSTSGDVPTGGSVVIENGEVSKIGTKIKINNYNLKYNTEGRLEVYEPLCILVTGKEKTVGSEYKCNPGDGEKNFYVLENIEESSNISLIMDRNIDDTTIAWCLSGNQNTCEADGALQKLSLETSGWNHDDILSITLPTREQIYNVNNNNTLTSTLWLYDNLDNNTATSTAYSYWTSTKNPATNQRAWYVNYTGKLEYTGRYVDSSNYNGVRPVIIVSKDNI